MKIAALVHYYVPYRNAGSETMLHTMLKRLVKAGHEVVAYVTDIDCPDQVYVRDGVVVINEANFVLASQHVEANPPDVIISHHNNTKVAARLSRRLGCSFVFIMHNDLEGTPEQLEFGPDLVVFNTNWIADQFNHRVPRSMVLHPPIWREDHETTPGEKVTLVNLNESKGAGLFYWLARNMPDVEFLGVVGGHGIQAIYRDLPNVEIQEHTDNMIQDVWNKTKILLMPSLYESYGMAGVEALASGIPVVANPTPGLLEALSDGGIFADRDDPQAWVDAIDELYFDDAAYKDASERAVTRSLVLNPESELEEFVKRIEELDGDRGSEVREGEHHYVFSEEGRAASISGLQVVRGRLGVWN